MAEEEKPVEEKKVKEIKAPSVMVVSELPAQQIRSGTTESGEEVEMVTITEALTEILKKVNKIEKAVA